MDKRASYKGYRREPVELPHMPEVLRIVDARNGVVYVNTAAREDAKLIVLLPDV